MLPNCDVLENLPKFGRYIYHSNNSNESVKEEKIFYSIRLKITLLNKDDEQVVL